ASLCASSADASASSIAPASASPVCASSLCASSVCASSVCASDAASAPPSLVSHATGTATGGWLMHTDLYVLERFESGPENSVTHAPFPTTFANVSVYVERASVGFHLIVVGSIVAAGKLFVS